MNVDICEMWYWLKMCALAQDSGCHLHCVIITLKKTRGMKTVYSSGMLFVAL